MSARHATIGAAVAAVLTHGTHSLIDADRPAYQRLVATIEAEEGFVGTCYADSLGVQTIGYGTRLPITEAEASLLAEGRLQRKEAELRQAWPHYDYIPIEGEAALLDLDFQVGTRGLLGFKKMLAALERFDYTTAADEVIDSLLDRETPKRAERVAAAFRDLAD